MSNKYIHYGSTKFDRARFQPIKNRIGGNTKPEWYSGMWASPVDAEWGWRQWCESEEFHTERLRESFTFKVAKNARVLHLKSVNDLKKLPELDTEWPSSWYIPDYEQAAKKYDAIQLHLSDEVKDRWHSGLYDALYGWDCDSILILNPDVIEECT